MSEVEDKAMADWLIKPWTDQQLTDQAKGGEPTRLRQAFRDGWRAGHVEGAKVLDGARLALKDLSDRNAELEKRHEEDKRVMAELRAKLRPNILAEWVQRGVITPEAYTKIILDPVPGTTVQRDSNDSIANHQRWINALIERVENLERKFAPDELVDTIKREVDVMDRTLFGNGPNVIERLESLERWQKSLAPAPPTISAPEGAGAFAVGVKL